MSDVMTENSSGPANIGVTGSNLGNPLQSLLLSDAIEPGADASYQLCKTIYLYHPLGAKMVELPLEIAQSQAREISIPEGPEERIKEAFLQEWAALGADKHIFNTMRLGRMYGVSAIVFGAIGVPTERPIAPKDLAGLNLYFNVLDPLNTGGSLVMNQNPNSPDFQKHTGIAVSGQAYHRSRACVILNEEPIYISYTVSGFGFVGRSVYQRALFPLKSFVQSMITDDLVTRKAGLLVAMIKQVASIADRLTMGLISIKRNLLKEAQTGNVINIGHEDKIESVNMQNADTAMTVARKNILENIAGAAKMPAQLINSETFGSGMSEGTEDAKNIARYIDGIRADMATLYAFFDEIVMYRAWNPAFYESIQAEYPEYAGVAYTEAFFKWKNSFKAVWPSLLIEPESELIKVDEAKMKAMISFAEVLLPIMDPDNKANVVQWMQDNFNELKLLFKTALDLDFEALKNYEPPVPEMGGMPGEGGQPGAAPGGAQGGLNTKQPEPKASAPENLSKADSVKDAASTVVKPGVKLTAAARAAINAALKKAA